MRKMPFVRYVAVEILEFLQNVFSAIPMSIEVLRKEFPRVWYCDECQKKANGSPKPTSGKRIAIVGGQNSPQTLKRFGNAKVKFISCEEVTSLSRDKRPYGRPSSAVRRSYFRHESPPNVKQSSRMKCTSPSRRDMQVRALKQAAPANHNKGKIDGVIRPQSPPNVKQSSHMKCVLPSRSDMQVHALKQSAANHNQAKVENMNRPTPPPNVKQESNMKCMSPNRSHMHVPALKQSAAANHKLAKIEDMNVQLKARSGRTMPILHGCRTVGAVKAKSESQVEDKAGEKKIVNADKEKMNSQIQDEPRKKVASCSSALVDANGCKSEMRSPNKDTLVMIDSSAEYSRRPSPASCWMGCFLVQDSGAKSNLGEFKAYFPSKVSSNVYEITKRIPINLELEVLPRLNDWPKSFKTNPPVHEDIGLFFFSSELDWREKKHPHFLENDFVMRAYINDIKLLIYSSDVLPPDSQWIDGETYLWGVCVASNRKGNPRLGSA
ncbi:hypothetical protein ACP70R_046380 [Stipagrostis hirtigluma subsp. patula]